MKILIVKLSALGDIVQSFPVLDFLKQHLPSARIHWVVDEKNASLVKAHPLIDQTISVPLKSLKGKLFTKEGFNLFKKTRNEIQRIKYDVLFDLQANSKSGLLTFLTKAKTKVGFSWGELSEFPNGLATDVKIKTLKDLSKRESYLALVKAFFKNNIAFEEKPLMLKLSTEEANVWDSLKQKYFSSAKKSIVISHGSAWENKKLKATTLIDFTKQIGKDQSIQIIWTPGSKKEKEEAETMQKEAGGVVLDPLPIPIFQRVLMASSKVIAMDSFALHLAGASNVPTFGIFGPSLAKIYAPKGSFSFQANCPYGISFERRCPRLRSCATGACLKDLSPQKLIDQFNAASGDARSSKI